MERVANKRERCAQALVSKTDGKRLLVSPRLRWEDNEKMILQLVVWGDVD